MTISQELKTQANNLEFKEKLDEAQARQIFTIEIEFVQCLCNPDYLQWLSKNHFFEQPEFINYLEYLQYWKEPNYASHLVFPQCLRFLDALLDKKFRDKLMLNDAILELKRQQSHQWIYYNISYDDVARYLNYPLF